MPKTYFGSLGNNQPSRALIRAFALMKHLFKNTKTRQLKYKFFMNELFLLQKIWYQLTRNLLPPTCLFFCLHHQQVVVVVVMLMMMAVMEGIYGSGERWVDG